MADRPAREKEDEIEITPEMIEAGLDELYNHDITEPRKDDMRLAVRSVYSAMYEVLAEYRRAKERLL